MHILNPKTAKTDIRAGIVIPTALRHDITPFLDSMQRRLLAQRVYPRIYLRISPSARDNAARFSSLAPLVDVEIGADPIGHRIHTGFDKAAKDTDIVVFLCDDFDHLLSKFGAFVRAIGQENEVLLGEWDRMSKFYLPYSMWLNEAAMSAAVTYLKPSHPISIALPSLPFELKNLEYFIERSKKHGTWTQVYIGLLGVVSQRWESLRDRAHGLFRKSRNEFDWVGSEAGLVLAAFDMGLNIAGYTLPKRFEHPILVAGSGEERGFAAGRQKQFDYGRAVVEEYADICPEKFQAIATFMEMMHNEIGAESFHWPGRKVRPSKWNSGVRTGF